MYKFDVVVVGAGPAGGHCARLLAKTGHKVLLVERFKDFSRNSFSSGGTPSETLQQFNLPESVVGSFWNRLVIVTSNQEGVWESETIQGSVLDFSKLRQFLADEVKNNGGEVWLGCRYMNHLQQGDEILITIKNNLLKAEVNITSQILVDATGPARSITCRPGKPQPEFLTGTGVEYLIEVNEEAYKRNLKTLTFLLGYKWMPKGYSWVFPMENNQLKVGAGVLNKNHKLVKDIKPLKHYIDLLINEYVKPDTYKVLDVHGETLRYSQGLQDIYSEGRVIAIGDTVSTVNFLGGEGIRHAMLSSEVASRYINEFFRAERKDFSGYQEEMHNIFLAKWTMSERLGIKKYIEDADILVDRVVSYLKPMKLEDIVDILFYYRFEKVSKGFWSYILRKLKSKFGSLLHWISLFLANKVDDSK
ncbi:NAD(P)/FAD-dependent oxidoreductase [Nodularia sp. NIES-3585]|uniref:NAD(P)/FAD-dependent oxidoreductase n=1 Tax=Nodularia sp. NIES-3585 TaxID=1973477 RepID=UPI000B5C68F5|nr:NAD(P)/FAD-dependent oxidoreductase [Nodularia sp. NIES-3585]GAX34454.1 monooxygenase FAD-binding protein [Nodularia sp. NIES-3585]